MKPLRPSHLHRSVHALHFGFTSGLVAATFMGVLLSVAVAPLWGRQAGAATSNFAANSFWNAALPSYAELHPNSTAFVGDIVRQVNQYGAVFDKDNTGAPVYQVESGMPTVSVQPWDCGSGIAPGLSDQWQAVPIPFYAVPSSGSRPSMVIYQHGSGTVWELGHARKVGNQWQACTGGRISSASDGVFASPFGVTASGLAVLGGQLGIGELQTGQINHVIGLNLAQVNGSTWPATQTNGAAPGSPPMGLRLRLDPTISVESLGLHPSAAAVARAAQTYGFVVWHTPGAVGVTAESPVSLTTRGLADPYAGILNGANSYSVLANFPWDRLQVLPQSSASSRPLPTIGSFTADQRHVAHNRTTVLSWSTTNISRCAIPGIADNLGSSGTVVTPPLKSATTFIIRCGGPYGVTSSQVTVQVSTSPASDVSPALDAAISLPYSGYANVITDLLPDEVVAKLYKVVYYENATYLYETATPPFALNTERMKNGTHTLTARLYFRDGGSDQKTVGIKVNNSPETLFAVQTTLLKAPPVIHPVISLVGLLAVGVSMFYGTRWGWRRGHHI